MAVAVPPLVKAGAGFVPRHRLGLLLRWGGVNAAGLACFIAAGAIQPVVTGLRAAFIAARWADDHARHAKRDVIDHLVFVALVAPAFRLGLLLGWDNVFPMACTR